MEIDKQKCFKMYIDAQFKSTENIIMNIFKFYGVCMVMPFFVQMAMDKSSPDYFWWVISLNISCEMCCICLVIIEYIQISNQSLQDYLSDAWNYFDISHFVVYQVYFFARIFGSE